MRFFFFLSFERLSVERFCFVVVFGECDQMDVACCRFTCLGVRVCEALRERESVIYTRRRKHRGERERGGGFPYAQTYKRGPLPLFSLCCLCLSIPSPPPPPPPTLSVNLHSRKRRGVGDGVCSGLTETNQRKERGVCTCV